MSIVKTESDGDIEVLSLDEAFNAILLPGHSPDPEDTDNTISVDVDENYHLSNINVTLSRQEMLELMYKIHKMMEIHKRG